MWRFMSGAIFGCLLSILGSALLLVLLVPERLMGGRLSLTPKCSVLTR